MSKWIVNIHGDIEGDYEIIGEYQEPKTDILDKIRAIVKEWQDDSWTDSLSYECMIKISELFTEGEG